MARRIYLHIGNHKTASTALQMAMNKMDDPRIFKAWAPYEGGAKPTGWSGNSWVLKDRDNVLTGAGIHAELARNLIEFNPEGDVIFSAEDMSWVFEPEVIARFASELRGGFDEFKVIVYLRRQDRNLTSLYNEGIRPHQTRFARFTGVYALSMPEYQPHFDLYFDYNQRIGHWADAFGDEAILVACYEEIVRNEGMFAHFFDVLGCENPPKERYTRQSNPKAYHLISLILRNLNIEMDLRKEQEAWDWQSTKPMPPRARALEFYELYAKSNQELQERFLRERNWPLFDGSFEDYPEEGNEDWDEVSAREAVDFLLTLAAREEENSQALRKEIKGLRRQLVSVLRESKGD